MRVATIMCPRPVTVRATTSVGTVARTLARHGVTALPVVDDRDRLVGIVSEADVIAHGIDTAGTALTDPVSAVMGSRTVVVHPETDVAAVGRVFARTHFKSLPVVDAADQVVGIVSRSDVLRAVGRDDECIEQDVADMLVRFGLHDWRVRVRNGVVSLSASRPGAAPRAFLETVSTTPGVAAVHTS